MSRARIAFIPSLFVIAMAVSFPVTTYTQTTRDKFVISAKAGGVNAVTGGATMRSRGNTEWQQLTIKEDLETGDVVAGIWFPMPGNPNAAAGGVWHPQDEAFLNWFARNGEAAGLAPADGRFTYMGVFGLPAQAC